MGTGTITADMNSVVRDTARERQRDIVDFVRAYGVEGEIGFTEYLGHVVISLPPPAAACASSVREFAKHLLPGVMVDVVVRAKPEPRKPSDVKFNITFAGTPNLEKLADTMASLMKEHGDALPADAFAERIGLPPPVDPRARREAQRCEIDAVLREDARRFPAFAVARKCAVMAAVEAWGDDGPVVRSATAMLGWLREYESLRGAFTKPNAPALNHARATFGEDALASYERARRLT